MDDGIEITKNFIDVERIFAQKNPGLYKLLPGFVFSFIKRLIHQDPINSYIYKHREKFGLDFIDEILKEFGVTTQLVVPANVNLSEWIQPEGRYIIASNHPLGGMDGMALMQVMGKVRRDIVFPVNDLLMNLPGLRPLFIPINKHGKNTENAAIIDQTFASNKMVLFFPAGLVSRKQNGGIIKDLEWKKTFISKAKRHQRDIIPVFIDGHNSNRFYNIARWRQRLGIKANIEMILLPDEMIRQQGKTVRIVVGKPIPYTTFDKSKSDQNWALWVQDQVYSLNHR